LLWAFSGVASPLKKLFGWHEPEPLTGLPMMRAERGANDREQASPWTETMASGVALAPQAPSE
jgi:hypothetical protein